MIETLLAIVLILLGISVYYNIRFGIFILQTVDKIEQCLDILDEKYQIFGKISEKPVFFDSVEIRQVIQEIKGCQDAVLEIANTLNSPGRSIENEKK